jgi:biopolymer transport protein ExbB
MLLAGQSAQAWWNKEWNVRKKITVDTTSTGAEITDPIGSGVVLVRLHQGNYQFGAGRDDGADIRFVDADDKTLLPFHIEKFDALMNEGFAWVRVPDIKPGEQKAIWMYYGNAGEGVENAQDSKKTYSEDVVLVQHLADGANPPKDATGMANNARNAGVPVEGAMIGSGLRFLGRSVVTVPASDSLAITAGGSFTFSAWVKPGTLKPNSVIYSRNDAGNSFQIGIDNGIPYVEVKSPAGVQRTAPGAPITAGAWRHIAVVADGSAIILYLDGDKYATLNASLPAFAGSTRLGGDATDEASDLVAGESGYIGELDEVEVSRVAQGPGAIKFEAISQGGGEKATKLVTTGDDEIAGNDSTMAHIMEHVSLFGEISKSLTFDGWAVIFLCSVLAIVGWAVTIKKFIYLNRIKKGSDEFLKQWQTLSADLTQIDHRDEQSVKSLGGKASPKIQKLMLQSPLYHIYHIGSQEISNRLARGENFKGLSARSIQAIRASLDGGLVREVQNLNDKLIFLTIGIAGGPYLGLLGTVIGVMITFAVIAKTGEVEINSIAPGIAGALLATVAGLAVAIPALFAYSYLSTRIKDAISDMQMFIDEFVTKMAEFYPEK